MTNPTKLEEQIQTEENKNKAVIIPCFKRGQYSKEERADFIKELNQ